MSEATKEMSNELSFAVIFRVQEANPNGDMDNEGRPRMDDDGFGRVSKECIKHKIRKQLSIAGENVLYYADNSSDSLVQRIKKQVNSFEAEKIAKHFLDVKLFGLILAVSEDKDDKSKGSRKPKKKADEEDVEVTSEEAASQKKVGYLGCVSVNCARSLAPVEQIDISIVKSINSTDIGDKTGSDRCGRSFKVKDSRYLFFGGINGFIAHKNGVTKEMADKMLATLPQLFKDDISSCRPAGSMWVEKVIIWDHKHKTARVGHQHIQQTLRVNPESGEVSFVYDNEKVKGLIPEPTIIDGF